MVRYLQGRERMSQNHTGDRVISTESQGVDFQGKEVEGADRGGLGNISRQDGEHDLTMVPGWEANVNEFIHACMHSFNIQKMFIKHLVRIKPGSRY